MNRLCIAAALLASVCGLDYSDLDALGVNCPDKHSCNHRTDANPAFPDRNCECDSDCSLYHDCCIDAAQVLSRHRRHAATCTPFFGGYQNRGAFMVNRCRRSYNASAEVRGMCGQRNLSDPLMAAPATDLRHQVTYSSRYCAACNNAIPGELSPWVIRVSCEFLVMTFNVSEAYIVSNLEYVSGSWGVHHWDNSKSKMEFYACNILFDMPASLSDGVRLCRHGVVDSCPTTWRRAEVKRKCEAYTAVVYRGDYAYKNPHCALCNDIRVDRLTCERSISSRKKQPLSFALLLDINRSDGEEVGMEATPSCRNNEVYDPFLKRCQSVTCGLPGYTMVNGNCRRN